MSAPPYVQYDTFEDSLKHAGFHLTYITQAMALHPLIVLHLQFIAFRTEIIHDLSSATKIMHHSSRVVDFRITFSTAGRDMHASKPKRECYRLPILSQREPDLINLPQWQCVDLLLRIKCH